MRLLLLTATLLPLTSGPPGDTADQALRDARLTGRLPDGASYDLRLEDGLLHGEVRVDFPDGRPWLRAELDRGRLEGRLALWVAGAREHNPAAPHALLAELHFEGGRRHGPFRAWDRRSTPGVALLVREGAFERGLQTGPWTLDEGRGQFEAGLPDGRWIWTRGSRVSIANYDDGVPAGGDRRPVGLPPRIPYWSPDTAWQAPLKAIAGVVRDQLGPNAGAAALALTQLLCQVGDREACGAVVRAAEDAVEAGRKDQAQGLSALACRAAPGAGCRLAAQLTGDRAHLVRGCAAETPRDGAACAELWQAGGPHADWYRRAACLDEDSPSIDACRAGCEAGDGAACLGLARATDEPKQREAAEARACALRVYEACPASDDRLLCLGGPDVPTRVVGRACQRAATRASGAKARQALLERACVGGNASCGAWLASTRSNRAPTAETRRVAELVCQLRGGDACTAWGEVLEDERAGEPDVFAALGAYDRACTDGDPAGCDALGRLRLAGPTDLRDPLAGLEQLRRGCTLGSTAACVRFAVFLEERRPDAPEIIEAYGLGCRLETPLPCLLGLTSPGGPPKPAVARALAERLASDGALCTGSTGVRCLELLAPAIKHAGATRDPAAVEKAWARLCAGDLVPQGSCP